MGLNISFLIVGGVLSFISSAGDIDMTLAAIAIGALYLLARACLGYE